MGIVYSSDSSSLSLPALKKKKKNWSFRVDVNSLMYTIRSTYASHSIRGLQVSRIFSAVSLLPMSLAEMLGFEYQASIPERWTFDAIEKRTKFVVPVKTNLPQWGLPRQRTFAEDEGPWECWQGCGVSQRSDIVMSWQHELIALGGFNWNPALTIVHSASRPECKVLKSDPHVLEWVWFDKINTDVANYYFASSQKANHPPRMEFTELLTMVAKASPHFSTKERVTGPLPKMATKSQRVTVFHWLCCTSKRETLHHKLGNQHTYMSFTLCKPS